MLSDLERKVLRIIINTNRIKYRSPTIDELCLYTGRDKRGIYYILQQLNKEGLIQWEPKDDGNITLNTNAR